MATFPINYYGHLSGRLHELGMNHGDLAHALSLSNGAISHRFRGLTPWSVDEMYKALKLCKAKPEELHIYFPPIGGWAS